VQVEVKGVTTVLEGGLEKLQHDKPIIVKRVADKLMLKCDVHSEQDNVKAVQLSVLCDVSELVDAVHAIGLARDGNRFIPASQSQPDPQVLVEVVYEDGYVCLGYRSLAGVWIESETQQSRSFHVTYWRPA